MSIIHCYSLPAWVGLFEDVASRSRLIQFVSRTFDRVRGTLLGDLMLMGFAGLSVLRCFFSRDIAGKVLTFAIFENERRAMLRFEAIVTEFPTALQSVTNGNAIRRLLFDFGGVCASVWMCFRMRPLLRTLSRKRHFVTLCQTSKFLVWYEASLRQMTRRRPTAVVYSSIGHPEAVAVACAAQQLGIPVIFASHASFVPDGKTQVPLADFYCFYAEMCRIACEMVAPVGNRYVLWGMEGRTMPMRVADAPVQQQCFGVFLTAPVDERRLREIVEILLAQNNPREILIRPHPLLFLSPNLGELERDFPKVRVVRGAPLSSCLEQCSIVFAGNSNVHRDVLRAGIPAVYVEGLDPNGVDLWHFVREQVVLQLGPDLLVRAEQLRTFYDAAWQERYKRFDASFGESPEVTRARVAGVLGTFLREWGPAPACPD